MTPYQTSRSIDTHRCSGCGRCVAACRSRLVTLEETGHRKQASFHSLDKCTNCMNCFRECPLQVIVRVDLT